MILYTRASMPLLRSIALVAIRSGSFLDLMAIMCSDFKSCVSFFGYIVVCFLFKPSDSWSDGHCASNVCSLSFVCCVFFYSLIFDQTAVMIYFMIKSGFPDSLDGPDLICLSQTHWPRFLNRFDPPRAQFTNRPVFSCLSPIFSTVLLNTPLFFILHLFSSKNYFLFVFFHFKNIFALY